MTKMIVTVELTTLDGEYVKETFRADLDGFASYENGGLYDLLDAIGTPNYTRWHEILCAYEATPRQRATFLQRERRAARREQNS